MRKITQAQKNFIHSLAQEISERELSYAIESTSYQQRYTFERGKKPSKKTKSQIISELNQETASELIMLLKDSSFMQGIAMLAEDDLKKTKKKS